MKNKTAKYSQVTWHRYQAKWKGSDMHTMRYHFQDYLLNQIESLEARNKELVETVKALNYAVNEARLFAALPPGSEESIKSIQLNSKELIEKNK